MPRDEAPIAAPPSRVAIVTLGCAKNLVARRSWPGFRDRRLRDGPAPTGGHRRGQHLRLHRPRSEGIDRPDSRLAALKQEGRWAASVVAGCLATLPGRDPPRRSPRWTPWWARDSGSDRAGAHRVRGGGAGPLLEVVAGRDRRIDLAAHRAVSPPRHVAYLRIADGCDFRCTSASSRRSGGSPQAARWSLWVGRARLAASGAKDFPDRAGFHFYAKIATASPTSRFSASSRASTGSSGSASTTRIRRPGARS